MNGAQTTHGIDTWPARLEHVIAERCVLLKRVFILRETESTQDAARRMNGVNGDVFIAWRQTAGRGRLGRPWADTSEDGIAMTIVLDRDKHQSAALAISMAIGTAVAIESILNRPVGIKWPNDVLIDGRKVAGILIEQVDDVALVGIGVNVSQSKWPEDLTSRAVSILQAGVDIDRLDVLAALLPAIDVALQMNDSQLNDEFSKRDVLRGRRAQFKSGEQTISGVVIDVDPLRGLSVRNDSGDVWLDAARTTLLAIED
jgi:BirA family biotin operon repressor/biotin-[acetyl-CoA-carboxylase] ligase